jgi:hypothetical protein
LPIAVVILFKRISEIPFPAQVVTLAQDFSAVFPGHQRRLRPVSIRDPVSK